MGGCGEITIFFRDFNNNVLYYLSVNVQQFSQQYGAGVQATDRLVVVLVAVDKMNG